jgi:CPA1 family monovalent cation:H+ antiporter
MQPEIAFVALFSVATAVAVIARRAKVPYTVALVVAGLLLGSARVFDPPRLTKELLYAVFLPGLIFEAAFALELEHFRKNKLGILSLAIPGLLVAIGVTTAILVPTANALHFVSDFTFGTGLVFAALIAATDPIAVVGLFKSLGAPHRLRVLIEGESLLNDGTAIVIFTLVAQVVISGHGWSPSTAAIDFARVVGMGALIGTVVGYSISVVIHKIDDAMIEITLTTIAAYGSFVAAEHFHFSGVIATVVAGMFCGNHAKRTGMSSSTRIAVGVFWEYLAFALNSIVFLLIGFEVRVPTLFAAWMPIVAAYLAVTVGRAVVIAVVSMFLRATRERLPKYWALVLTWGGLRGGLSMVLVLGLPPTMPHRELVVTMTFGVVILSILIQGPTMGLLLRRLGLIGADRPREYERLRARIRLRRAALGEVERVEIEGTHDAALIESLRGRLGSQIAIDEEQLVRVRPEALRQQEEIHLRRRTLTAEKSTLLQMHHAGEIGDEVFSALRGELDEELIRLGDEIH